MGQLLEKPRPEAVKAPSLRRSFSWSLFGTAVFSATNWGMQIALAKLGSPEVVGQYNLGVIIAQPVLSFLMLQLRSVQSSDTQREYRFADYLALRLFCMAIAALMIAAIAMGQPVLSLLLHYLGISFHGGYDSVTVAVIAIVGFGMIVDTFSDIYYGLFQQQERMDWVSISMSIKGVLSLTGLAVCYSLTHNVIAAVGASTLASILVVLGYDIPTGRRLLKKLRNHGHAEGRENYSAQPRWDKATLWKLFQTALPLGLTLLMLSLSTNVSRFFLEHYRGLHELGIFSALASLIVIGRTAMMALGQTLTPRLARYYKTGDLSAYRALLTKFLMGSFLLAVSTPLIAKFAGRKVLTLFYTSEYAHNPEVFFLLLAGGGISYIIMALGFSMTAAGHYKVQMYWFGAATVISVFMSAWLIPTQGLRGAAIATIVTSLIQLLLGAAIMARILGRRPSTTEI